MEYRRNPLDTSRVQLTPELAMLTERIAENAHDVWASRRLAEGWAYGAHRDDHRRQHPGLVPYSQLSDAEREYDRATAMESSCSWGFKSKRPSERGSHVIAAGDERDYAHQAR